MHVSEINGKCFQGKNWQTRRLGNPFWIYAFQCLTGVGVADLRDTYMYTYSMLKKDTTVVHRDVVMTNFFTHDPPKMPAS